MLPFYFYVEEENKIMTEKTHAVGSLVFATGAFLIMDKCNMLDTQIVKIAQYGIITPYALWGAQIPDFDQDNPNRIVTNPVNRLIMDLFKVLGAKHRGIISHVLPIFLSGIVCLLMQLSIITFGMHKLSLDVLHLMLLGLFLGLLSHLILDMCTKDADYSYGVATDSYSTLSYYLNKIMIRKLNLFSLMVFYLKYS